MTVIDLDTLDTPLHPAANESELALLQWARDHEITRPQIEISRGRYRTAAPGTTKAKTWTRMSGLAKTLDDTTGLETWRNQLIALGFHTRRDLLDSIDPDNKATINAAVTAAALQGGDHLSADLGSAMHCALEHLVSGSPERPPAPWDEDLDAIATALHDHGIQATPDLIEAILINPQAGAVGRTDLIVTMAGRDMPLIADLKTGSKLDYGIIAYAAQLAGYATSTHYWDGDTWQPVPAIDQTAALIIHAPLGTGTCTIHEVDLAAGAQILDLCVKVRERRRGGNKLATPLTAPARLGTGDDQVNVGDLLPELEASLRARGADPTDLACGDDLAGRAAEARERIKAIRSHPDAVATVTRAWPAGTPHRPPWTSEQLDAIELLLHQVDGQESTWLGTPDPKLVAEQAERSDRFDAWTDPTPPAPTRISGPAPGDGAPVPASDIDFLKTAIAALPEPQRLRLAAWVADGKRRQPWGPVTEMGTRTHAIYSAAIACAIHLWDDDQPDAITRAALHHTIDEPLNDTWPTGAVLGSLTIDEANRLRDLATRYGASEQPTVALIGATVITYTESSEQ